MSIRASRDKKYWVVSFGNNKVDVYNSMNGSDHKSIMEVLGEARIVNKVKSTYANSSRTLVVNRNARNHHVQAANQAIAVLRQNWNSRAVINFHRNKMIKTNWGSIYPIWGGYNHLEMIYVGATGVPSKLTVHFVS